MSIDEEKAGRYLDEIRSLHAESDRLEKRCADLETVLAKALEALCFGPSELGATEYAFVISEVTGVLYPNGRPKT